MEQKNINFLVGAATLVAVIVFGTTLVHALWYAPDSEATFPVPTSSLSEQRQPDFSSDDSPVRLQIPSLGIDANVQNAGLNGKGNMASPSNFTDVAWYRYGTVPGQVGSAVIDGHVDNGLGLAGVFKHLSDIQIGDDVYVLMQSGVSRHFVVADIESYDYRSAPVDEIFNRADTQRLNLVTCEGAWVQGDKTYDHRLVVYTELVAQ